MVDKFRRRFWVVQADKVLAGKISKSRQKAAGAAMTEMHQQANKIRASLSKTVEENFYLEYPTTRSRARSVRRLLVNANRQFEKTIGEVTKDYRAKVLAAVKQPKNLKP